MGSGISPDFPYLLIRVIAQSSAGTTVYLAREEAVGRLVAIKLCRPGTGSSRSVAALLLREAYLQASLDHPNVVSTYEVGTRDGVNYTVSEFLEGPSLAMKILDQPLTPRNAASLMTTLAKAMDYVHSFGIIHRDLKPANIVFSGEGTPKITDFGLAIMMGEPRGPGELLGYGVIVGNPAYMAPEQVRGDHEKLGPATDVYALGVMLYEMLSGRRPFQCNRSIELIKMTLEVEPQPPSRCRPGLPRELDRICLRCLKKEPQERYPSAGALADDLERFLAGKPLRIRPLEFLDRMRRRITFNRLEGTKEGLGPPPTK